MARSAAPMLRASLLCAALLCAARADDIMTTHASVDAVPPVSAAPQPLLALGTVLHAPWAPEGARSLETDALVYLRCYATSSTAAYSHPDSMLNDAGVNAGAAAGITPVMVAAAASAARGAGLHATLPVEHVTSAADVAAASSMPPARGNAYAVGDWAALKGADLWCELYDIDRAAAGLADALGGALLRAADFAAAGTDTLSVTFVSVVGGAAQRAATVSFRCPLCVFGDAPHEAIASAWLQGASITAAPALPLKPVGFTTAAQLARTDALAHAAHGSAAAYAHAAASAFATLAAESGATELLPPDVADLIEAIAHAAAAGAHHADGGVDLDVPHTEGDATASSWLGAMIETASDHAAAAVTAASLPMAPPAADDAMAAMEAEAVAAVREATVAARRRNGDVSILVYALAGLTTRLAAEADVPIALTRTAAATPMHVREAVASAREERWGDHASSPDEMRVWAVVAATLAAVACGAALTTGAVMAWRRRGGAVAAQAGAAPKKLKRKNSDFRPDIMDLTAVGGGAVCEVPLGTPRDATPRGSATPRSARREAGANAA